MEEETPISNTHITVRARRTDPETAHQAAFDFERDQTKAQRSVATVTTILAVHGPLTDFQILELWSGYWGSDKWSESLPRKARHWAREKGMVKHAGYGTHQNRRVRLWAIGRDDSPTPEALCCPTCGRKMKP